jgi:hypothetical protein
MSELIVVNTRPEPDPYFTNQATQTVVYVVLSNGQYGIVQEDDANAITRTRWHQHELAATITRPDQTAAVAYMQGAAELVDRIIAGSSIDYDGRHLAGNLDDDARAAWDQLVDELGQLPSSDWTLWHASEWIDQALPNDAELAALTDDQISSMAAEYADYAESEHAVIAGSIQDAILAARDLARAE